MKLKIKGLTIYRMNYSKDNTGELNKKLTMFGKELFPHLNKIAAENKYYLSDGNYDSHAIVFSIDLEVIKKEFDKFGHIDLSRNATYHYDDFTTEPFSLFGLGQDIRCNVFSHLKYKFDRPKLFNYDKDMFTFDPNKFIAKGTIVDLNFEIIRYIANSIHKSDDFSIDEIESNFKIKFETFFKDVLRKLIKQNYIIIKDNKFVCLAPSYDRKWKIMEHFVSWANKKLTNSQIKNI